MYLRATSSTNLDNLPKAAAGTELGYGSKSLPTCRAFQENLLSKVVFLYMYEKYVAKKDRLH